MIFVVRLFPPATVTDMESLQTNRALTQDALPPASAQSVSKLYWRRK